MSGPSKAPNRDLLLAHHTFPGPYTIKAFGPGDADFPERVQAALQETHCQDRCVLRERKSGSGRRICITIEMDAQSVDAVIALYEALHRIDSLQLIL